jgi:propionyl-CoA synthetase
MSNYAEEYQRSLQDPEGFWKEKAQALSWIEFPKTILAAQDPSHTWFGGGRLNMSALCLDVHLSQGRGEQVALYYDSPVTGRKQQFTYSALLSRVEGFAGGLKRQGLSKGDTVVIYMPMIPEAVVAMLACARLGLIHSVVFGGFAAHELALRIEDCQAKALITATGGVEVNKTIPYLPLVKTALDEITIPTPLVIVKHREELGLDPENDLGFLDFSTLENSGSPAFPEALPSEHPLYILYTSGTTGKPKGIVRDTGGYAVALHYSMQAVYGAKAGEVFWAASDVGWVVGHSYIVYGPLLKGMSTVLYEGKPVKTPDAGAFWRMIEAYKINILFAAPTAFRAIRKEDPEALALKKYQTSSLKYLFLAGERCDPNTYHWAADKLGVPVTDHWWQTETGWPIVSHPRGLGDFETKAGAATYAVPGYAVEILDSKGSPLQGEQQGLIAIKKPLPPGCLTGLWNNPDRYKKAYFDPFPGYYFTGDGGYRDQDGYFYIMGRVDDVINVAGHRLSTGEMEEVIAHHPSVAECCVVGVLDELKGQMPLAFVVVKDLWTETLDLEDAYKKLIREKIGAIASLKGALLVKRLPKTRSGKILRKTLRSMVDKEPYTLPSTIDDPLILSEIQQSIDLYFH